MSDACTFGQPRIGQAVGLDGHWGSLSTDRLIHFILYMSRTWENWDCSVWGREGSGGSDKCTINTRGGSKKADPDSSWQSPVTEEEATGTI